MSVTSLDKEGRFRWYLEDSHDCGSTHVGVLVLELSWEASKYKNIIAELQEVTSRPLSMGWVTYSTKLAMRREQRDLSARPLTVGSRSAQSL